MSCRVLATTDAAAWNSALALAGIDSVSSPCSISSDFFEATGRRARSSRRIPFARIEDPRVAAGGSTHVLTSSTFFSSFGMPLRWGHQRSSSTSRNSQEPGATDPFSLLTEFLGKPIPRGRQLEFRTCRTTAVDRPGRTGPTPRTGG